MNKLEINLAYSFAPRFERRRGIAAFVRMVYET